VFSPRLNWNSFLARMSERRSGGLENWDLRFVVQGSGFGVWGSGFGDQGAGVRGRDSGLGFWFLVFGFW